MGKVMKCVSFVVLAVLVIVATVDSYKIERRNKRQSEGGTIEASAAPSSTISDKMSTPRNTTVEVYNEEATRVGLVIGVIVGIVAAIAVFAVIVAIWIKNKRDRDSEYARAAKVQMNSTKNAGVYNDLTTTSPIVKVPLDHHKESSEMDRLKKDDDEEI